MTSNTLEIEQQELLSNLTAKAASAGHKITKCCGGYMLSRWAYSRYCADLDAVQHLLKRMGIL